MAFYVRCIKGMEYSLCVRAHACMCGWVGVINLNVSELIHSRGIVFHSLFLRLYGSNEMTSD